MKVEVGDKVKIKAQGILVTGKVVRVDHWEGYGWDIELTEANVPGGYSHWKQGTDGGEIVEVIKGD